MVCDQVDVVGKSNHMLAVPMLSLTLEWAAKLKGNQLDQPLSDLLADCCHRLRTHFAQFIMDRVGTSHRALPASLLLIVLKATCFPSSLQYCAASLAFLILQTVLSCSYNSAGT